MMYVVVVLVMFCPPRVQQFNPVLLACTSE
jgi:hypothetical protein